MKIPPLIVGAALTAILALQGWMLTRISTLSEQVAGLTAKVEDIAGLQHIARK